MKTLFVIMYLLGQNGGSSVIVHKFDTMDECMTSAANARGSLAGHVICMPIMQKDDLP